MFINNSPVGQKKLKRKPEQSFCPVNVSHGYVGHILGTTEKGYPRNKQLATSFSLREHWGKNPRAETLLHTFADKENTKDAYPRGTETKVRASLVLPLRENLNGGHLTGRTQVQRE